ncbi:MAG: asparaginase [Acidimicrobiales bacterium]|nr:asparaginase [Acidimicrobiales bacterium]
MQHRSAPIMVEIRRGDFVESTHQVHAVVATADQVLSTWGDSDRLTMPRSAIKSIQVLPMLALGAAAKFDVSDDEIALASSSHSAEAAHTTAVASWLERIGMDLDALECGPSDPINDDATRSMYRSGQAPTSLHNCCSGKHTGFLTLAKYLEDDPAFAVPGYLDPAHGVQSRVRDAQALMTGVDLQDQVPVIDGCGIPVYQFPLVSLAQAMARLVTPEAVPAVFAAAAARVTAALPSRSFLVSGTGRAPYVLTEAATEPMILKGGAEGVMMGALPERGIGFALKCEDGNGRGVDEAVAAVLHQLGLLPERVSMNTPLLNRAGTEVGSATVAL